MSAITQIFAVIGGLFHVAAFVMESLLFRRPAVQRLFLGHNRVDEGVFLWAFNQGFYNLFVAAGAIGGVIAYHSGAETVGRALTLYACAFMAAAGVVLAVSDRRLWRGALGQAVPPLIALLGALLPGVVLALLGSPLLGPAVWTPVADELSRRGWTVIVPPQPDVAPRSGDDVRRWMLGALPADRDLVPIPHSNAGLYVPGLTAERNVAGYVFVDAGLPAEYGRVPLAPPALLDLLTAKADIDGLLPLWTDWWDRADTDVLFPSAEVRARVEREQRALPVSYFRESLPVPPGWDSRPGAYVAFGDTYAEDRQEAVRRGWPVTTLSGHHLHMLVEPHQVAAEIATLLAAIGFEPDRH